MSPSSLPPGFPSRLPARTPDPQGGGHHRTVEEEHDEHDCAGIAAQAARADRRGAEGHFRVVAGHRFRVVRLLPVRLARGDHRQAVLLRRQSHGRLHLRAARVRRRLRRAAVRRAGVRPPRRPGRTQVHVPRHDPDHGLLDVRRRPAAELRADRHRRAGDPDRVAPVAGARAGRRIRRRGDVRRRALAGRSARCLYRLDPDDGDARARAVARRHRAVPPVHARDVRHLGLAHPVPAVADPADLLGVHPPAIERVADLPAHEGGRQGLEGADHRIVRQLVQPQDRAARAVRPDGRRGGGVVRRPVLRAVLHAADAQGRRSRGQHPGGPVAADRHAVLRHLRRVVGQDRPQADHHGGLHHRRADLFPAVQGAHALRQPGARGGAEQRAGDGDRRPEGAARSSSIRSARRSSRRPAT